MIMFTSYYYILLVPIVLINLKRNFLYYYLEDTKKVLTIIFYQLFNTIKQKKRINCIIPIDNKQKLYDVYIIGIPI